MDRKIDICSFVTWMKRNRPRRFESSDGLFNVRLSIEPTLVGAGFSFVSEEASYCFEKKPKVVAERLIRDNFNDSELDTMEFVYHEHRGSHESTMPDVVMVYGRKKAIVEPH